MVQNFKNIFFIVIIITFIIIITYIVIFITIYYFPIIILIIIITVLSIYFSFKCVNYQKFSAPHGINVRLTSVFTIA